MAVKIRLARKGRKKLAYYHIVVADSRSPRDGRYIEKIGRYNPLTNPASIELDFDKAIGWLQNGAIPTETCRAILSYKGVLLKKHLLEGVKKGAFDEAEATRRFEEWMNQNEAKIEAKKSGLEKSHDEETEKRLAAEKKINEARAAKLAKKQAELAAKEAQEREPEAADEAAKKAEEEAAVEEAVAAEEVNTEKPEAPSVESEPVEDVTEKVNIETGVTGSDASEEASTEESGGENPEEEKTEENPEGEEPEEKPEGE